MAKEGVYVCLLVLGAAGIEQCKELFDELIHRQSLEAVELFAQFAWEQGGDLGSCCLSYQVGARSRSGVRSEENKFPALSTGEATPFPVLTHCRAWAGVCSLGL